MDTRRYTDEQLRVAILECDNYSDVLRKLGLRTAGANWKSIKKHIVRCGYDISHFSRTRKSLEVISKFRIDNRFSHDEIFCVESPVSRGSLKVMFRKLSEYKCSICSNVGEFLGKPLVLQLDHINGVNDDNRLENLRWLCPNCHSQTDTFSGRNRAVSFCKTCKIPTLKKSEYCSRECRPKLTTPLIGNTKPRKQVNWPDANVVFNRVLDVGYEKCGIELNVSGNGVKRFLSRNNLIVPRYHAQSKY